MADLKLFVVGLYCNTIGREDDGELDHGSDTDMAFVIAADKDDVQRILGKRHSGPVDDKYITEVAFDSPCLLYEHHAPDYDSRWE